MIKAFFIALGLLTRIPVLKIFQIKEGDSEKLFGWSVLFYPLVGLMIGGFLVLISWCLSFLTLPSSGLVEAAILLTVWVLITGALHLDGLADSADAWLGGYGDQQRTLDIMKDPYSGPVAVVVLVLVLLLKFSMLINIEWQWLLFSPVLARTSVMILLATTPYVRKGGMAELSVKHLPKTAVWFFLFLILSLSVFTLKEHAWGLIILFAIAYLLRRLMLKRIQGTTGDTAGAMLEIMEVSILLVFILLARVE
ncbi:MAG: adenosylcobinamide-GDP ribazoletransferase [Gammaproteobacteria bacterium]|nr:adenosylcobinamide-GDP ribazoletransferase [Gammaproteobacteria bacterium]MDH5659815.1 adenosylcobinamide-GDP ribazoletransferase [Gammaproteobacteria bacterium]